MGTAVRHVYVFVLTAWIARRQRRAEAGCTIASVRITFNLRVAATPDLVFAYLVEPDKMVVAWPDSLRSIAVEGGGSFHAWLPLHGSLPFGYPFI